MQQPGGKSSTDTESPTLSNVKADSAHITNLVFHSIGSVNVKFLPLLFHQPLKLREIGATCGEVRAQGRAARANPVTHVFSAVDPKRLLN